MSKNTVKVVAAVFYQSTAGGYKFLIFRRAKHVSYAGSWEFPGGKIELGESEQDALIREIHEELQVGIKVEARVGQSTYQDTSREIHLVAYLVSKVDTLDFQLLDHDDYRWMTKDELLNFSKLSQADRPLINQISDYIKNHALF